MSIKKALNWFELAIEEAKARDDSAVEALAAGLVELAREIRRIESTLATVERKIS